MFLGAAAILVLAGLLYYFYAGTVAPPGQHPLVYLQSSNFAALQRDFNNAPSAVRVVVLLSPT